MKKDFTFELIPSRVNCLAYSIGNGNYHRLCYTFIPGKYESNVLDDFIFLKKYNPINKENPRISLNIDKDLYINKCICNLKEILKYQNFVQDIKHLDKRYIRNLTTLSNDIVNMDIKYNYREISFIENKSVYIDNLSLLITDNKFVYKISNPINDNSLNIQRLKKAYETSKTHILEEHSLYKESYEILINKDIKINKGNDNNEITMLDNLFLGSYNNSLYIINYYKFLNKHNNEIHMTNNISLGNDWSKNLYISKDSVILNTNYSGVNIKDSYIFSSKFHNEININENFYLINKNSKELFLYDTVKMIGEKDKEIYINNDYMFYRKDLKDINNSPNVINSLSKFNKKISLNNKFISYVKAPKNTFTLDNLELQKNKYSISFEDTIKWGKKSLKPVFYNLKNIFISKESRKIFIDNLLKLQKNIDDKTRKKMYYPHESLFVSKDMHHFQYQYENKFMSKDMHHFQYQYENLFLDKFMHFLSYQYENYFIDKYPNEIILDKNIFIDKNNKSIFNQNTIFANKNNISIFENDYDNFLSIDSKRIMFDNDVVIDRDDKPINIYDNTFVDKDNDAIDITNNIFLNYFRNGINLNKGVFLNREKLLDVKDSGTHVKVPPRGILSNDSESLSTYNKGIYINDIINIKKDLKEVFIDYDNMFVHVIHYDPDPEPELPEYEITGKIDELILPHEDFKYETYLPKLIDKDGGVNPSCIKSFDSKKNRYTVSVPVENPIDVYATIGRKYLDLDTGILECIINKVIEIWKKNMYRYIAMFATDALKNIMDLLFNYITDTFTVQEEYDQAIRCLQLFRWYAEMAVLNNCDYDMYFDSKTAKIDYYNQDLADLSEIIILNNMDIDDSYLLESLDVTKPSNIIFKNTKKNIVPTLYLHMRLYNINGKSSISIIEDEKLISETIYDSGIHELDLELKDKIIIVFDPTEENQNMAIANAAITNYPEESFNILYKGRFGDINNVMQELLNELKIYNNVTDDVKKKFRNVSPTTVAIDTLTKYFEIHHKDKDKGRRLITKK